MTTIMNSKPSSAEPPQTRKGEENKFWFRSDRIVVVQNMWFFTTRENRDAGPFNTRKDAVNGLELFIDSITQQNTGFDNAIEIATKGEWSVTMFK